tara:strand:+ start:87 stop:257 length:171 start_codon:yes stop_codon:yes gene_type:complete
MKIPEEAAFFEVYSYSLNFRPAGQAADLDLCEFLLIGWIGEFEELGKIKKLIFKRG